jgi:hypothetical protein
VTAAIAANSAANNFVAMVVAICVASVVVVAFAIMVFISRLRRAACWAPIYLGMSPCARALCCLCGTKYERDHDRIEAAHQLAQVVEVRNNIPVYDRVIMGPQDGANYDRVSLNRPAAYEAPSSPIDT